MLRELTEEEIAFVSGGREPLVYRGTDGQVRYQGTGRAFSGMVTHSLIGSDGPGASEPSTEYIPPDCLITEIEQQSQQTDVTSGEPLMKAVHDAIERVGQMHGNTVYGYEGLSVRMDDLYKSLSMMDFIIMDNSWTQPGTSNQASVSYNNGNPSAMATGQFLNGHAAHANGLAFYSIHEAVHGTLNGYGYSLSNPGASNETAVNEITLAVMKDAGIPVDRSYPGANVAQPQNPGDTVPGAIKLQGDGALASQQRIC